MSRKQKRPSQSVWDATNPRYASLNNPEWTTMKRVPAGFWHDPHNHRRYIRWLAKKLGVKKVEDWYRIKSKDFTDNRGGGLLEQYDHSHIRALQSLFPQFDLKPWLFPFAPTGYWNNPNNIKSYIRWFETKVGIKKRADWYAYDQDDLIAHHSGGLIDIYACSLIKLLSDVYPKFDWKPWLFKQTGNGFWRLKRNRVAYLKWLEKKLGYRKPTDWYRVTKKDFANHRGGSLIVRRGSSIIELVGELYPKRQWYAWKFKQVPQRFWKRKSNRIKYLRWLGERLNYKETNDWYRLQHQDFEEHGGLHLLKHYYRSELGRALKEVFPQHEFLPWKFTQVPNGFWDERRNCRAYLRWLAKELGYTKQTDWYRVTLQDFVEHAGTGFIKHFRTPYQALKKAYPNYRWLPWLFVRAPDRFWNIQANRVWYLNWLAQRLKLKSSNDWQTVSAADIRANRGSSLVNKFSLKQIHREAIGQA